MEYPLSSTFRLLRRHSLWLLIAFFIALAYFSASNLQEKLQERQGAAAIVTWTENSIVLNRLISELQRERGLSSGFIASGGSKFSESLEPQRGRTDNALIQLMRRPVDSGDLSMARPSKAELDALRTAVNGLRLSREVVFERYTQLIDGMFRQLTIAMSSGQTATLYRQQLALVFLAQAKEMTGQERALVTMMFSAHSFGPMQMAEFHRIRATEKARIEKFQQLADPTTLARFAQIDQHEISRKIQHIRQLLHAIGASDDASHVIIPEAEHWFQLISQKIDMIGTLEDELGNRLVDEARTLASTAKHALWMNAFTVLISFVLAGLLIAQILGRRKDVEQSMLLAASVFRSSAESIVIADKDCQIIDVNDAFVQSTGYQREEVVGKHTRLLRSGRHDQAFYAGMWSALTDQGLWQGEIWNRRKNGEIFPALLSIVAVRNHKGSTEHYIGISSDLARHKQVEALVEQLRTFDPLTGLPNRDAWLHALERVIQESHDQQGHFAVLEVGVDRFKAINETLGFAIGDKVLMHVADRLKGVVKRFDLVARLGGDRFSLLLPETPNHQVVAQICQRIGHAFAHEVQVGQHNLHITVSIGVAMYPEDGIDGDTLRRNAEFAMYVTKQTERSGYNFYTREMNQQGERLFAIERMLHNALERQEFSLAYQPQVDAGSGKLVGVEALLRWQSPELGQVSPVQFIPIAEETGLIVPIGTWVLQEACRQAASWQTHFQAILPVAVNLSAKQFRQQELSTLVSTCLAEHALAPACLELEITESHLVQNPEESRRILEDIRATGVRIALDDFGTGYSSLAYLKHFPIDRLKIDRAFVTGLPEDPDDQAISRSIIGLGQSLGMEVLAEGVETAEQAAFLALNGCQTFQGYYYGKPRSAEQLLADIQSGTYCL